MPARPTRYAMEPGKSVSKKITPQATCINNLKGMVNIYFCSPTAANVEGWQETGELNWCVGIVDATPVQ